MNFHRSVLTRNRIAVLLGLGLSFAYLPTEVYSQQVEEKPSASSAIDATDQAEVRVMSFNIRFGTADDGPNHWKLRKELVDETIRKFDPDLLGTQETLQFQADYLRDSLGAYTYFGRSRMNDPNEHCGLFFKTERFVQLAGGHFWLSETPEVPASKGWDAALPRMATWVLLHDRQGSKKGEIKNQPGRTILFLNTHFDHQGEQARLESGRLVKTHLDRLKSLGENLHIIVTGDFNCGAESPPYQALVGNQQELRDTYRVVHPNLGSAEGTFGAFVGTTTGPRIDWILCSPGMDITHAEIDHLSREGRYPSDHFPVTAALRFRFDTGK